MDPTRFDTISKLFARRKTRRSAIAGGLGLAAASVGSRAFAQDATPAASISSTDFLEPAPEMLYVQPFDAGAWAPKAGEDGVYTLTITGAAAQTVYFSDRPERIVGLMPNQEFLDTLGFTPENPPNAAVVATDSSGQQDILVIELLNPQYDADAETLTYDATVLSDYGRSDLAYLANQQQDYELDETFGAGSLFIDAGLWYPCSTHLQYPTIIANCYLIETDERVGVIYLNPCDETESGLCKWCASPDQFNSAGAGQMCAALKRDQCTYDEDGPSWNCYIRPDDTPVSA